MAFWASPPRAGEYSLYALEPGDAPQLPSSPGPQAVIPGSRVSRGSEVTSSWLIARIGWAASLTPGPIATAGPHWPAGEATHCCVPRFRCAPGRRGAAAGRARGGTSAEGTAPGRYWRPQFKPSWPAPAVDRARWPARQPGQGSEGGYLGQPTAKAVRSVMPGRVRYGPALLFTRAGPSLAGIIASAAPGRGECKWNGWRGRDRAGGKGLVPRSPAASVEGAAGLLPHGPPSARNWAVAQASRDGATTSAARSGKGDAPTHGAAGNRSRAGQAVASGVSRACGVWRAHRAVGDSRRWLARPAARHCRDAAPASLAAMWRTRPLASGMSWQIAAYAAVVTAKPT